MRKYLLLLMLSSIPSLAAPLDLNDCFKAALVRSEDLSTQQELIFQAEERLGQAKGSLFPSVNGLFNYLTQPTPNSSLSSSISPSNQSTSRITATQPIFRGLREYAALKQGKILVKAERLKKEQVIHKIFEDLVQSYYQVLSTEKDIQNLQHEVDLNEKRLKELDYFRRLGRSRPSEVLTLRSNIAALEAQKESLRGQLSTSRAILAFQTGLELNLSIKDSESRPDRNFKIETFLSRVEMRPDIQALKESYLASEEGVKIAWGQHLPSADLSADYYFQRPGLLSNVLWDVQFTLTLPIFQGGIIQSLVRQASSVQNQNELALTKAKRQAERDIESLFSLYKADYAQLDKQKRAVDLSKETYEADVRDYKLGLVTNLEVLQSLTASQESLRLLNRVEFQLKADFLRLQSVSALKPLINDSVQP